MRTIQICILCFSLGACSITLPQEKFNREFNLPNSKDYRAESKFNESDKPKITDGYISIKTENDEELSGSILENYTSAMGEKCWKIITPEQSIISICFDGEKYRVSRNIFSGTI